MLYTLRPLQYQTFYYNYSSSCLVCIKMNVSFGIEPLRHVHGPYKSCHTTEIMMRDCKTSKSLILGKKIDNIINVLS